jgi:prolipoprotein diacylglyceryltransferase
MFPSFELFGRTIGTYSLVTIIGIILACLMVFLLTRKKNIFF